MLSFGILRDEIVLKCVFHAFFVDCIIDSKVPDWSRYVNVIIQWNFMLCATSTVKLKSLEIRFVWSFQIVLIFV